MSGWILKLLPMFTDHRKQWHRNWLLGVPHGSENRRVYSSRMPTSLSTMPFLWDYHDNHLNYEFIGGIVGYSQSGDALKPEMGWAVRPKSTV